MTTPLTYDQAVEAGQQDVLTARTQTSEALAAGTITPESSDVYFADRFHDLLLARIERGELAGRPN